AAGTLAVLLGMTTEVLAAPIANTFTTFGPFGLPGATTAPGPSQNGSPNYSTFALNAATALQAGFNGVNTFPTGNPQPNGNSNSPSFFGGQTGNVNPSPFLISTGLQGAATAFPSWLAQLNPATNFGAAYGGEIGNALYFPVRVQADPG